MIRLWLVGLLLSGILLEAKPAGFQLLSGEAKPPVVDAQGVIVLESGKSAIVQWDAFSIGEQEVFRFQQADSHSAILNRVAGFSKSCIDGSLLSNGHVFLINPYGVVVGQKGAIQTASILLATHDLSNDDFFCRKEMRFRGDSKEGIINLGTIEATQGSILLIGQEVHNQGHLLAPEGSVVLACGKEVWIRPHEREQIFIRLPVDSSEEAPLQHSGTIQALRAELQSGVNPYEKAIRLSGKVEALSVREEGGHIYLFAQEGRADISGELVARRQDKGGEIDILGKELFLQGQAFVNASGEEGGGVVRIGGDQSGANPEVPNALHTFIGPEVKIAADAERLGNGGKVIVWGDEAASFHGHISVCGGEEGGDGGFAEVSGKTLQFRGFVDRRSPRGNLGTLLLDPIDITIGNFSGLDSGNVVFAGGEYTFLNCTTNPAEIDFGLLSANLGAGNVVINTSASGGDCGSGGTITLRDGDIISGTPSVLSLIADRNIIFQAATITFTDPGSGLTLVSDNAFPSSIGPGGIQIPSDVFSIAGPFRLYVSTQGASSFPSTLNGAPFSLQTGNSSFQQFNVFFPGGTYIGPQYMIFFKQESPLTFFYTIAVASTAIDNILVSSTSTSESDIMQGPFADPQDNPTDRENTTAAELSGVQTCY